MANSLTGGYGLRPIGITGSGYNTTGTTMYEIASNYTTAIYQGGIVIPLAGGTIAITDQAAPSRSGYSPVWCSSVCSPPSQLQQCLQKG